MVRVLKVSIGIPILQLLVLKVLIPRIFTYVVDLWIRCIDIVGACAQGVSVRGAFI